MTSAFAKAIEKAIREVLRSNLSPALKQRRVGSLRRLLEAYKRHCKNENSP